MDSLELRARLRTTVRLNRFRLLHEERARYQQLFELSPVGVALVGKDGRIVLANPTFMALLGVGNLDQLQAHPMLARVAPAHQAECLGCLMAVLGGDLARQRVETAFLSSDGHEIPAEVTVGAVPFAGGTAALVIARDMRERFEAESRLRSAYGELNEAYEKTLEGWVRALDLRDQETQGHTERVTGLTLELAETLGLEDSEQHLRRGALLHDVGKIGVPDAILLKPGALTEDEWQVMRLHPIYAYQWLSSVPFLASALEIPYAHHERWDGAGYPRGLRGEEIPLSARLFAVVDVYDALTSDRPYRKAWTPDQALTYLERHSGSQFDPHVTQVFLRMMQSRLGADGAVPPA
ncbi:MAG: HD domain-containing phosphohydrolase [Meiothermus sp.]|nr:HD domain-containing phosphohydrolase [Meiothermus sp.]